MTCGGLSFPHQQRRTHSVTQREPLPRRIRMACICVRWVRTVRLVVRQKRPSVPGAYNPEVHVRSHLRRKWKGRSKGKIKTPGRRRSEQRGERMTEKVIKGTLRVNAPQRQRGCSVGPEHATRVLDTGPHYSLLSPRTPVVVNAAAATYRAASSGGASGCSLTTRYVGAHFPARRPGNLTGLAGSTRVVTEGARTLVVCEGREFG